MTTHRKFPALLVGLAAALLAVVIAGGVITVFAQTNGSETDRKEAYLQSLANRLGVDVDTLKQAIKDTNLEQLDQLVQEGVISQETADAIREKIESSDTVWFGVPRGFGRFGFGPGLCGTSLEELATFLGTDVATLRSEIQSGKSLAQIAEAHGKSRDELKTFLTDQVKAKLDEAVANGRITQEEADAKLESFTANLDSIIDAVPAFKGFGRGHHRHGWFGKPDDSDSDSSSSTSTTTSFRY
ncbi:hypothetical protein HRbin29_01921 [bacterium HR29]|jgi:uncharacterized protein YidB (DUF937 family)|nr:hypothetical protein HRbin29_01921 [bacterium HR29]